MRGFLFNLLIFSFLSIFISEAKTPRTAGLSAEWGGGITFLDCYSFSYLRTDGTRLKGNPCTFLFNPNAHLLIKYDADISSQWNLSVMSGYEGIYDRTRIIPLTVRGSYFPGTCSREGRFWFLEGGTGVKTDFSTLAALGRIGWGKRFHLSEITSLDFMVSYRSALFKYDHIDDPDEVPVDQIYTNRKITGTVSISVALRFQ